MRKSVVVAKAFLGGQVAHPEGQNEEENQKKLRKIKKIWSKYEERMRKLELLPTQDCEAGYGPGESKHLATLSVTIVCRWSCNVERCRSL